MPDDQRTPRTGELFDMQKKPTRQDLKTPNPRNMTKVVAVAENVTRNMAAFSRYSFSLFRYPLTYMLIVVCLIVVFTDLDIKSQGTVHDWWLWLNDIARRWAIVPFILGGLAFRYLLPPFDPTKWMRR